VPYPIPRPSLRISLSKSDVVNYPSDGVSDDEKDVGDAEEQQEERAAYVPSNLLLCLMHADSNRSVLDHFNVDVARQGESGQRKTESADELENQSQPFDENRSDYAEGVQ